MTAKTFCRSSTRVSEMPSFRLLGFRKPLPRTLERGCLSFSSESSRALYSRGKPCWNPNGSTSTLRRPSSSRLEMTAKSKLSAAGRMPFFGTRSSIFLERFCSSSVREFNIYCNSPAPFWEVKLIAKDDCCDDDECRVFLCGIGGDFCWRALFRSVHSYGSCEENGGHKHRSMTERSRLNRRK
jgi:hypothetical protein